MLSQPYPHIHIVLVDDGSTDGSGALCDRLAAEHAPRAVAIHQENAGVSAARNAGIGYALSRNVGGYLAFLDADDAWTQNFFDDDTIALLTSRYELIGFQSCNCDKNLRPYSRPNAMRAGKCDGGQDNVWLHGGQHFGAMLYACKLIEKENIRFFEELKYSEDKVFSMQSMYLANVVWLENRVLYHYRHTGTSAMSRRAHGIPYFAPILKGYLKLDEMMRNTEKAPLIEARNIVGVFTMEMIAEHYQFLRPKKKVDVFLANNHEYISILKAEGEYSNLKPNVEYESYVKRPRTYIFKNLLIGGGKMCKKVLRKVLYPIR